MSKLIKSCSERSKESKKIISIKKIQPEQYPGTKKNNPDRERQMIENQKAEADKIIFEAKQAAQRLKEQIEKEKAMLDEEKNRLFNEAREAGFAEGMRQGREKGYQETADQLQLARNTVECSKRDYRAKLESSEETILALGIKVAEKILAQKLDGDPEQFLPLVKQVLKEAKEYKEIGLHVNPVHYEAVLLHKEELLRLFPREIEFYIYPDENLSAGSCIIESPHGRIDASIDRQLEEIKRSLFSLLGSE